MILLRGDMINYVTIVKMGTNKSFVHLIKHFKGQKTGKVFNCTNMFFSLPDFLTDGFWKDKFDSSKRPKCFCSSTFATSVPLKIICRWFWRLFLQENKTSVAFLSGSGLNSNFHWWAYLFMTSMSWFKSLADISFTIEKSIVSSAKNLILDLIFFQDHWWR